MRAMIAVLALVVVGCSNPSEPEPEPDPVAILQGGVTVSLYTYNTGIFPEGFSERYRAGFYVFRTEVVYLAGGYWDPDSGGIPVPPEGSEHGSWERDRWMIVIYPSPDLPYPDVGFGAKVYVWNAWDAPEDAALDGT